VLAGLRLGKEFKKIMSQIAFFLQGRESRVFISMDYTIPSASTQKYGKERFVCDIYSLQVLSS